MKFALLALVLLGNSAIAFADETLPLSSTTSVQINSPEISATPETVQPTARTNDVAFYAMSLSGTPYKYGGDSPDTGFDCSGFVGYVYRQVRNVTLPRSAHEINLLGKAIKLAELRPGDLVFYKTLRRTISHVGIYLGGDRFVHSPSRGGSIRVDSMLDKYWRKRFKGARRIVSDRETQDAARSEQSSLLSAQATNY